MATNWQRIDKKKEPPGRNGADMTRARVILAK
mgnify:CR=1 FL=1